MGFIIHFYIIFGTNLLTGGPTQIAVFFPYFSVSHKKDINRSPNGMKPSGELFLEKTQSRRLGVDVRGATGCPQGSRVRPHPRGPLVAPLTNFFRLYIPIYPENIQEHHRSGVSPVQVSVATKNQPGPCSGTVPKGGPPTGGHLHHPDALHDEEGVVHPRG